MIQKELNLIYGFLYDLCNKSRKITLLGFNQLKQINYKEDGSPVTRFDFEAENIIRKAISKKFPNHNILSEENLSVNNCSDYTWIIDPIDGTKSFIIGRPLWGTMIGLIYKNKPIIGIVDFPCLGQTWLGDNSFCYLNKKKYKSIRSFDVTLSDAVIASTDPDLFEKNNFKKFEKIKALTKRNCWSGDCHNYLLLANGGIDIVVEENLSSYDILPLVPILKSQKILISDWSGKDINFKFDKNIKYQVLASVNSNIHKDLIKIL